jgi:hypothetical protein
MLGHSLLGDIELLAISLTERGWSRSSRRISRRCGWASAWNAASLTEPR